MSQDAWTEVDRYLTDTLLAPDPALEAALADSEAGGLPAINVAPNQGKLLMLLAQMAGAKRILEIGALGGYSTIWLARALPADGRLITLEYVPHHAEVARRNIARAGFAAQVEVKVGAAIDTLPTLQGPFDFVFIDADKASYPAYFEWSLKLARPGAVIVADNAVRAGKVLDPQGDADAEGVRRMYDLIAAEPRATATAVQTVGSKGWDGFCLIRVKSSLP
ncbi:MAG TPA: O-methyltransferase [Phenylobacterium sp.]|uniref:O-methyltransferase n=1 Tax=Phenylobacterium sp. TaxID=1871053 RepID=UPI002B481EEA|nr:O-methyltransferase [Phenylobacterium sp.]HKR87842.1 O-methyltransferase [Phenylobacterium sp.]